MAKTINCAFCGKEMNKGFFNSEVCNLSASDIDLIYCCDSCHDHYKLDNKHEQKRFETKVINYKKSNGKRKLTQQELAKLYVTYFTEMNTYKEKKTDNDLDFLGYFYYNDNGQFYTNELVLGSVISTGDMAKTFDKLAAPAVCTFEGEDISRLEYRITSKLGSDTGKAFTTAYLFEIHFNDPKEMTYRPSIAYFTSTGTAFLPHKRLKKAEERIIESLSFLKNKTGTSAKITKIK